MQSFTAPDQRNRYGRLEVDCFPDDGIRLFVEHEGMGWRGVTLSGDDALRLLAWLHNACGHPAITKPKPLAHIATICREVMARDDASRDDAFESITAILDAAEHEKEGTV